MCGSEAALTPLGLQCPEGGSRKDEAVTKRRLLLLGIALLALLLAGSIFRNDLIGWWRGEAKYKGWYTNAWRAELRLWEKVRICGGSSGQSRLIWVRRPASGDEWLAELFLSAGDPGGPLSPPLFDNDPEAVPVLAELLRAPEPNVRLAAVEALQRIGPPASDALRALLLVFEDDDEEVRQQAAQALQAIRPIPPGTENPRAENRARTASP